MAERELNRSERAAIRKLVTELCANYDSQDKICLPLNSPCYMLNKWWTGAYCRYFEKAVLPVDAALESAITGEDTSMRQKICPVCGKVYLPITSQAYCCLPVVLRVFGRGSVYSCRIDKPLITAYNRVIILNCYSREMRKNKIFCPL